MSKVFGASKPSPVFGPKGAGNNGNFEGPPVIQAYFPGGRLSETIRGWQARVGQRSVVQARRADKGHAFPTPPGFLKNRVPGSGQPLQAMVKSQMEPFFQTDFSNVRVHVGPEAPSIGALAFTVGTNLYFAPGQYLPNTPRGRHLIGHELTHVVQQAQGRVSNPYGSGLAVVHDPGLEEEAEQQGKLAAKHPGRGRPAGLHVKGPPVGSHGIQCAGDEKSQKMTMQRKTGKSSGMRKNEVQQTRKAHLEEGRSSGGWPPPRIGERPRTGSPGTGCWRCAKRWSTTSPRSRRVDFSLASPPLWMTTSRARRSSTPSSTGMTCANGWPGPSSPGGPRPRPACPSRCGCTGRRTRRCSNDWRRSPDGAVAQIKGGWDGPALQPMADALKEFEVLQKLTAAQDGKVPGMEPYVAWLQQLAAELSDEGGAPAPAGLAGQLPPIGRLALAERLGEATSYGRRLDTFLRKAAVPADAWVHFRAPMEQVRALGDREIESTLAQQWSRVNRQVVTPLLAQYPFARSAREAARAEELEALHRPSGAFWQFFLTYAAPLAEERVGVWRPRGHESGKSLLPPGLLDLASRLGRLSPLLWDAKGQPQPLRLHGTPRPLPNVPCARVSLLRCGQSEVKGFNQRPAEQELRVSWWAPETAAAGLALAGTPADPQDLRQVREEESPWSCLRVLEHGKSASDKATNWEVGLGKQGLVGFTVTGEALKIIQDTAEVANASASGGAR